MFEENYTEIDIDECWRIYPFVGRPGFCRAYVPPPFNQAIYVQARSTRQRFGFRKHFVCQYCNKNRKKLYVFPNRRIGMYDLKCRECLKLRYECQYDKAPFGRLSYVEKQIKTIYDREYPIETVEGNLTQHGLRLMSLSQKRVRLEKKQDQYFEDMKAKFQKLTEKYPIA